MFNINEFTVLIPINIIIFLVSCNSYSSSKSIHDRHIFMGQLYLAETMLLYLKDFPRKHMLRYYSLSHDAQYNHIFMFTCMIISSKSTFITKCGSDCGLIDFRFNVAACQKLFLFCHFGRSEFTKGLKSF